LKGRDYFGDVAVNGRLTLITDLKTIRCEAEEWIHLVQDRNQ
jgi:hypothetical protein